MSGFWPVTDVLAYLSGIWRVERSVRDLVSGAEGTFGGTTEFEPLGGGGLLHHESGTFVWQGVARPAERTLRFLPGESASRADVRFADGRPFHDLDLTSGRHIADHPCAADLYRGEFTVLDADHWRTVWRVGGPAKNLLLTTDYARTTDHARAARATRPVD
ncbi:hypothetical protein FE633_14295 [Streptomyces montanus]|uniref:DUF6314 domain-containing protein n=1 Tax=Streptomyces montanus TaxID=2580423 RepID=A0A5R9FNS7_9ACTN|nr:DUF6314 family protein [Streptomyces montanus]TLS45577.1 hypothetical protein FE633_14295 [Streptomyces montanus]